MTEISQEEKEAEIYVHKFLGAHAFNINNAVVVGIYVAIMVNELRRDHEYSFEHLRSLFPYMKEREIHESYKIFKSLKS